MRAEAPQRQERWNFSIPKERRLTPSEIATAGENLYLDFLGPRKSREGFMMNADTHDLAYRLIYLAGTDEYKRKIAASISAATEVLDGVVRKDGLPHLRHALRVGLRTMYRLIDDHGTLTDKDIEKVEIMIQHDTKEDGLKDKKLSDGTVRDIVFKHLDRETNGERHPRNEEIYTNAALFDQYDDGGNKKPNYEQDLKDAGWSSEKMSDDTLDSLLGDISWATRLLRDNAPAAELNDLYILLAGTADRNKKGSIYKTEQRRTFFDDQLTHYDHNQIAIYLATANRVIQDLEERLTGFIPEIVPRPRRTTTSAIK